MVSALEIQHTSTSHSDLDWRPATDPTLEVPTEPDYGHVELTMVSATLRPELEFCLLYKDYILGYVRMQRTWGHDALPVTGS
jgi:hypothetical protein